LVTGAEDIFHIQVEIAERIRCRPAEVNLILLRGKKIIV